MSSASFYYVGKQRYSLDFVHFRFSEEYLLFAVSVDVLSEHVFNVVLMCFSNDTETSSGGISSISLQL